MILITGATGYVGRRLILYLLESGFSVLSLGRDLSVLDKIKVPEIVIHLAGKIQIVLKRNPLNSMLPPIPGEEDIVGLYDSNFFFTAKILDYCIKNKVKHLIFASSQAVYGMPEKMTVTEDSECKPLEHYGMSKLCAEHLLQLGPNEGINITILRFPGIYGGDKTNGTVYQFCHSAVTEKKIEVNIDYPLPFDVINIEDVIKAIEKSILLYPKTPKVRYFNISTGEFCNLRILAEEISELIPGCEVISSLVPQPVMRIDSSRAEVLLDWKSISRRERLFDLCLNIQNQI